MKYKIGDVVRVRTYYSLANEYGLTANGAIKRGFVPSMNETCGRVGYVVFAELNSIVDVVFRGHAGVKSYMVETLEKVEDEDAAKIGLAALGIPY